MAVDKTLDAQRVVGPLETTSGVRIEPITAYAAKSFLKRLDEMDHIPAVVEAAWGAFADVTLIGVGVLVLSRPPRGRVFVGVARDRRRLRVGTDLLELLLAEAVARGLTALTCIHPALDPGAERLVQFLRLTTARRVVHATAVMVVKVPKPVPEENGANQ